MSHGARVSLCDSQGRQVYASVVVPFGRSIMIRLPLVSHLVMQLATSSISHTLFSWSISMACGRTNSVPLQRAHLLPYCGGWERRVVGELG